MRVESYTSTVLRCVQLYVQMQSGRAQQKTSCQGLRKEFPVWGFLADFMTNNGTVNFSSFFSGQDPIAFLNYIGDRTFSAKVDL
jgi:hypothetical protein